MTQLPILVELTQADAHKFGYVYEPDISGMKCWKFEFEVQHASVFENGIRPFGALYTDCDGVPMIDSSGDEAIVKPLRTVEDLQNIYFEEAANEQC